MSVTSVNAITINLPIIMSNTNYIGLTCYQNSTNSSKQLSIYNLSVFNKQINSCRIRIADATFTKSVFIIGF